MDVAVTLRHARTQAGLTQAELGGLTKTSQATISAYESGRKRPSVDTLERLLAAAGARLVVERDHQRLVVPSAQRHRATGRALLDVLGLAELLPSRHSPELTFPRLPDRAAAA